MRSLKLPLAVLGVVLVGSLTSASADPASTVAGTVHTGIAAIGGETTGVMIQEDDGTWLELDAHGDATLAGQLDHLDGKHAHVRGQIVVRHGVEIQERHILVVSKISE